MELSGTAAIVRDLALGNCDFLVTRSLMIAAGKKLSLTGSLTVGENSGIGLYENAQINITGNIYALDAVIDLRDGAKINLDGELYLGIPKFASSESGTTVYIAPGASINVINVTNTNLGNPNDNYIYLNGNTTINLYDSNCLTVGEKVSVRLGDGSSMKFIQENKTIYGFDFGSPWREGQTQGASVIWWREETCYVGSNTVINANISNLNSFTDLEYGWGEYAKADAKFWPGEVNFKVPTNAPSPSYGDEYMFRISGTATVGGLSMHVTDFGIAQVKVLANASGGGSDPTPTPTPTPPPSYQNPFSDVSDSAWYAGDVQYVVEHGLFNGVGGGQFAPNSAMNRAMLVTVLYRLAGEPAVSGGAFPDVGADTYYTKAVAWAAANGIVNGINGQFEPDTNISRQDLAVMLYRFAGGNGSGLTLPFNDSGSVAGYARDAVAWCYANGIVNGKDGGVFDPTASATRAEVAAMIHRYALLIGE